MSDSDGSFSRGCFFAILFSIGVAILLFGVQTVVDYLFMLIGGK